jgi:transcriptional regulator with XRE-family HTH domain
VNGTERDVSAAERESAWPQWLAQRMAEVGLPTNRDLARAAGVPESVLSRWRNQGVTPSVEQLRRLRTPLQVPLLELLVRAGHLDAREAGLEDRPAPVPVRLGVVEALHADPDLPEDLRSLLLSQYRAMVAIGRARQADASAALADAPPTSAT